MANPLFKLTQDGEHTGFLEFCGTTSWDTATQPPPKATSGLMWYSKDMQAMSLGDAEIQWDAAHPFVCTDKNGKKGE